MRGMIRYDAAKSLGISQQQLCKYEDGKNRIAASTLHTYLEALGGTMESFFAQLASKVLPIPHDVSDRELSTVFKLYVKAPQKFRSGIKGLLEAVNE